MLFPDKCIILPTPKDAGTIASWIKDSSNARGFYSDERDQEPCLIIFDSYGATHDSARRFLGLERVMGCFIIQRNGDVACEVEARMPFVHYFATEQEVTLFTRIALRLGNTKPKIIPLE